MVKSLIDVAENVKKATDKRRSEARFSGSKGPSFLSPFDYAWWGIFKFILHNLWYIWQVSSRILIRGLKISGGMIETDEDSSRKKFNKDEDSMDVDRHRARVWLIFDNYLFSRGKKIHERFSYFSLNKNRKGRVVELQNNFFWLLWIFQTTEITNNWKRTKQNYNLIDASRLNYNNLS